MSAHAPIGKILVEAGLIDDWQLQSALGHQRYWGGRVGDALVFMGFITESQLLGKVAGQLGVPFLELSNHHVPPEVVKLVPEKLVRARNLFPIALAQQSRRGPLIVATCQPQNLAALDEVAFAAGMPVRAVLTSRIDLERLIERYFGASGRGTGADLA